VILQLIPAYTELWQVSAGPTGEVVFTRVVCIALAEHNETGQRLACPMIPGEHITMPDGRPEHVCYVSEPTETPGLRERCEKRRAELVEQAAKAEADKNKPKIIVPGQKVVTPRDLLPN
jgi:hypothetical protein